MDIKKPAPRKAGPYTQQPAAASAQSHTCDCWRLGVNQWTTALFFICFLKNLVAPTAKMLVEVVLWAAAAILTKGMRTEPAKTFQQFCKINNLQAPLGNCFQPVTLVISHAKGTSKVAAYSATSKGRNLSVDMTVLDEKELKAAVEKY